MEMVITPKSISTKITMKTHAKVDMVIHWLLWRKTMQGQNRRAIASKSGAYPATACSIALSATRRAASSSAWTVARRPPSSSAMAACSRASCRNASPS